MISQTLFRADKFRRFGLWLAALALMLQVLALPLSARHQIASALWESGAQTIAICTAHGLQNIKVGADGTTKPDTQKLCEHCVFCVAAGLALTPVNLLLTPFLPLLFARQLAGSPDFSLAGPLCPTPPAQAPPVPG